MTKRDFEIQEIAYENAMAERYDRDYHEPPIMTRHDKDFVAFVTGYVKPGDRILDLGCGPGSLWQHWKQALPDVHLIGVDVAPRMVDVAKRLWRGEDFRVGSMLDIPVDSATIDVVIASSTLHHIPDEALPAAFAQIRRVLTEHGTLVGREPSGVRRIADEPGWLSGAVMNFQHMVYRLTNTREYAEPENGAHHHAYDAKVFFAELTEAFAPKSLRFRHPFSSYVARCEHPTVEALAFWFDEWLNHEGGHVFYYAAAKNYAEAADITHCIQRELEQNPSYDRETFMALLQRAAEMLEREIPPARGSSDTPPGE